MTSASDPASAFVPILTLAQTGEPIRDERSATDLVGEALHIGAETVVVPVERLAPAFFDLRTGLAGAIVNKFAVYRLRLVIVGDVSPFEQASNAFRDFVREANRSQQLWFVSTVDDLQSRLRLAP
jgi:hypothetical protein